ESQTQMTFEEFQNQFPQEAARALDAARVEACAAERARCFEHVELGLASGDIQLVADGVKAGAKPTAAVALKHWEAKQKLGLSAERQVVSDTVAGALPPAPAASPAVKDLGDLVADAIGAPQL